MTTKTEPSNEQIAEALGFGPADFVKYHAGYPDFKNDNNTLKYVWPALEKAVFDNNMNIDYPYISLRDIAIGGLRSPNPALYFATEFWKLKKGK